LKLATEPAFSLIGCTLFVHQVAVGRAVDNAGTQATYPRLVSLSNDVVGVFGDERPAATTLALLPCAALLRIWTKIVSNSQRLTQTSGNWHKLILFTYCLAVCNNNRAAQ
jgi:hypothetical protein